MRQRRLVGPAVVARIAALALVARSGALGAQPARPAVARVEVELTSAAPEEQAASLEVVVRELLARLGADVRAQRVAQLDPRAVLTPRPAAAPAVARVWVEVQAGRATVYVADGPWERILVRHLPLPAGRLDEVAREQVGHLVQSSVEALMAGRRIGFERGEVQTALGLGAAPPPPPRRVLVAPPAPAPRVYAPPRRARFDLGGFYEAQALWGAALFAHGPGLSLAGSLQTGPVRVGLALSAAYRLPLEVRGTDAGVRLEQGAFRAMALVESLGPGRLTVRGLLGAGPDVIAIDPRAVSGSNAALLPARAVVVPIVRAGAQLAVRIAGSTRLVFGAAVELDPVAARYVVLRGDAPEEVLAPAPVRPSLQLAVETADLW